MSDASEARIVEDVRAARADGMPLEIVAGGTRRAVGRPLKDANDVDLRRLDVSGLSGIRKYEPEELIITAGPATPLIEVVDVLRTRNQRLGFDPADWSRLLGARGVATLGGAVSADASGAGRVRHGPARDSLLGFRAINGLGEAFRGGSRVVKNVTGFDLPKLVCGAFGTLVVLTELTFRVYPRPSHAVSLCVRNMGPDEGFATLRKIARSPLDPSGLAYLPGNWMADAGKGACLIRLEGAPQPLEEKVALARGLLGAGDHVRLDNGAVWFERIGNGALFADQPGDVWRLLVAPTDAPRVVQTLNPACWVGDWAGGLVWLAAPPDKAAAIRAAAASVGGQAMLLRASPGQRARMGLYAPQPEAIAALTKRIKAAFDPLSLFNPGRF